MIASATSFDDELYPRYAQKLKPFVINLLSKAEYYTLEGGSVTTQDFIGKNNDPYLHITDTWIGIGKDQFENVLATSGRAAAGLDRQFEGTGFCLALIHAPTKLHFGRLKIESKTNDAERSTAFIAIIPESRAVT